MEKEKTPVEIIFEAIKKDNTKALLYFEELLLEKEFKDKEEAFSNGYNKARLEFTLNNAR